MAPLARLSPVRLQALYQRARLLSAAHVLRRLRTEAAGQTLWFSSPRLTQPAVTTHSPETSPWSQQAAVCAPSAMLPFLPDAGLAAARSATRTPWPAHQSHACYLGLTRKISPRPCSSLLAIGYQGMSEQPLLQGAATSELGEQPWL